MTDPTTPEPTPQLFPENNPLATLDTLISTARNRGASKLLILAGKPILCRINGQLSAPLAPGRIHFNQTQRLVAALLSPQQHTELDTHGEIEILYTPPKTPPVTINIFYGDAAHNLIIFLT